MIFCLQQMSLDCTASEGQPSVTTFSQVPTYKMDFTSHSRGVNSVPFARGMNNVPFASSIVCRHEAIARTVTVDGLSSIRSRWSYSSHSALSSIDSSRQPHSIVSPPITFSSVVSTQQSHGSLSQNTLQSPFISTVRVSSIAHALQPGQPPPPPPNFTIPSSSVVRSQLQGLPTRSSGSGEPSRVMHQSLSRDHPSDAINRLREKIGRGWLPPEPPYPPPPDDVPVSHSLFQSESRTSAVGSLERNKIPASVLPIADAYEIYPESELYAEPPLVDSTTEVTTTTDTVDDDANELVSETFARRPIEREDGEISDDEPDSVGADLPPDSSGISSSNSHWYQPRPSTFRGFRVGGTIVTYRPRFPYRGRFPRGRGFFRGRGFAPWQQWYDHRPPRDWGAPNDEHIVDSSGVLSPPTEMKQKHSTSSRSPVHSPTSSSDSEEESTRRTRSDRHSSRSDRRSRHKSKSKHDDRPVADSTKTAPEIEHSSDSDKEHVPHSVANKKKVSYSHYNNY